MSTSIVDIFKAYKNQPDGDYNSVATEYATLDIEWVKKIGNQTISANTSWGNATADARNLLVLVKGDLTVNAGYTLTAAARKRGMFIYVNGNLTLNGTISMTARGANAAGQRLLLCNIGSDYEVPAAGGTGGGGGVTRNGGMTPGHAATNGGAGGNGAGNDSAGASKWHVLAVSEEV